MAVIVLCFLILYIDGAVTKFGPFSGNGTILILRPRVGADHGVDFDWSRQSRDCPDVSAKILNSSVQHCKWIQNSVCLSVCQTRALWQNGRKIFLDFYTTSALVVIRDLPRVPYRSQKGACWSAIIGQLIRDLAQLPRRSDPIRCFAIRAAPIRGMGYVLPRPVDPPRPED